MSERKWVTIVKRGSAALAIVGMLLGGVGVAALFIFTDRFDRPSAPAPTARSTRAAPPPAVPTAQEFTIGVVVTATECDPAGLCRYTYTIQPKYIGFHPFPPTEFTVEYEVTGGNAPQPGKFTVKGEQAQILKDVTLEGPPNAQLQARALNVIG